MNIKQKLIIIGLSLMTVTVFMLMVGLMVYGMNDMFSKYF